MCPPLWKVLEKEKVPAQDIERGSIVNVAIPATDIPETSPKVIPDRSSQEELPSRNTISRENSRVDALAATRHFFSSVNEGRVVTEVPTTTIVDERQIDAPSESSIHDEIEPTEPEIPSCYVRQCSLVLKLYFKCLGFRCTLIICMVH